MHIAFNLGQGLKRAQWNPGKKIKYSITHCLKLRRNVHLTGAERSKKNLGLIQDSPFLVETDNVDLQHNAWYLQQRNRQCSFYTIQMINISLHPKQHSSTTLVGNTSAKWLMGSSRTKQQQGVCTWLPPAISTCVNNSPFILHRIMCADVFTQPLAK